MDKVYLRGLQCQCVIGTREWESRVAQKLVLDVEMETDILTPAASDDLSDAVNYQRVAERINEFCSNSQYALLESLIEALAQMVLNEFAVSSVTLRLDKGCAVDNVSNVGIEITRTNAE